MWGGFSKSRGESWDLESEGGGDEQKIMLCWEATSDIVCARKNLVPRGNFGIMLS